jgi:CRP-like cAMP-binding protein
MYILEQGKVRVSARLLGEGEVELTTLGPGDVLGEIALVDSGARSATVRGVDPTTGYFIPQRHFDLLRLTLRPAAIKVMRQLSPQVCARLRMHYREIAGLTPRNVPPCQALSAAFAPPRTSTASTSALLRPERLRELPAFRAFEHAEIEELLRMTRVLEVDRGIEIFAEDAAAGDCFIIVRGAIQQVVTQDEAIECVATLGPGRMFGHLELIDGGPRVVSSRARENAVLLALDAKAFGTLYAGLHPLAIKFIDAALMSLVEAARLATRQVVRMTAEGRMRPQSIFPRLGGVS